jgi:hypothetical protein
MMTAPSDPNTSTVEEKQPLTEVGVRYDCLINLIDKALTKSRQAIDTSAAVHECYGDDASMLGEDANMLGGVVDSMLDKITESVKESMTDLLGKENIRDRLEDVEKVVVRLEEEELQQTEAEQLDSETARKSLEMVTLPQNVTPNDIMRFHAYEVMHQEKAVLQEQLEEVEREARELEEQQQEVKIQVEKQIQHIGIITKELERSADVCSMVS